MPEALLRALPALLLPLLLAACGQRDAIYQQESYVFGTRVDIGIADAPSSQAEAAADAVLKRFDALHRKLHAWQPSELSRLNEAFAKGEKMPVDPQLADMLLDAQAFEKQGEDLFNPAIGNLIRLWGFQSDEPQAGVPDERAVAAAVRAAPSMRNVHVGNGQAWSDNPAVRIDLGGYAKGEALDEAAAILKQQGIHDAIINIGGNVMALGKHGDRAWKVGIQHPRNGGVIATMELHDGEAIGTSGDYQRYFEAGGKRYCHLIDPRTGHPADGMESVSILVSGARAGVRSDVLTKPLFIGGSQTLAQLAAKLQIDHLLAVTSAGKVLVTEAMRKRLQWTDPKQAYELVR